MNNSTTFIKDLLNVQDDLLHFALKLTANKEEAHDLLQETALKALDNKDKFVVETNFKGWVYTIMRNLFINHYRNVEHENVFVDTSDDLYFLNTPEDIYSSSTEKAYELKELHHLVNSLPDEFKQPFAMHIAGFKYREIAEKLQLPLGTVKSRIFLTRQKLQHELKDFM